VIGTAHEIRRCIFPQRVRCGGNAGRKVGKARIPGIVHLHHRSRHVGNARVSNGGQNALRIHEPNRIASPCLVIVAVVACDVVAAAAA